MNEYGDDETEHETENENDDDYWSGRKYVCWLMDGESE